MYKYIILIKLEQHTVSRIQYPVHIGSIVWYVLNLWFTYQCKCLVSGFILIALSILKCIFAVNLQYFECVCKVQTFFSKLIFFMKRIQCNVFVVTYNQCLFFHLSVFSHNVLFCSLIPISCILKKIMKSSDNPSSFSLTARLQIK